jgi:hypothetical protein
LGSFCCELPDAKGEKQHSGCGEGDSGISQASSFNPAADGGSQIARGGRRDRGRLVGLLKQFFNFVFCH